MFLKFIAVCILLYYFFKSVGFIMRAVLGGGTAQRQQKAYGNQRHRKTAPKEGLHVDSMPNQQKTNINPKDSGFKGGDYVDYEEVE